MRYGRRAAAGLLGLAACAGPGPAPPAAGPTPDPVPTAAPRSPLHGTLPGIGGTPAGGEAITVRYPPRDATIATDSTFVFGQIGVRGGALEINGVPVLTEPNGAFLAYLAVPADGLYRLRVDGGEPELVWPINGARAPGDAGVPAPPEDGPPPGAAVWDVRPEGYTLLLRGEPVTFAARAAPGTELAIALPDGRRVRMYETRRPDGSAGFGEATAAARSSRYEATVELATGFVAGVGPDSRGGAGAARVDAPPAFVGGNERGVPGADVPVGEAFLEAVVGGDTVSRVLPGLGILEPGYSYAAEVRTTRPDSTAIGRATAPPGTPYHWFLPNGTRVRVNGLRDGQARVRLTDDLSIWLAASDLAPVEPSAGLVRSRGARVPPLPDPGPGGALGDAYAVRAVPGAGGVDVRVSLSERLPFRVDVRDGGLDITVYGARTRTNWAYQGPEDPDVRRVWWEQAADERYVVHVEADGTPWGWDARWEGDATLVVRVARPPSVDPADPLRGLYVGVDAGHGDASGAIGPTGLFEGAANRQIARRLVAMLEARGARVLEIRPGPEDVSLGARPTMAADSGVHVLISVHNNAFGDGVNPFDNAGTSVLYNTWQSLPLARALQRELVAELRLRDLGPIWGDLALARPTRMPSVLTETMFLMVPVQEAALRDADVQRRIAEAHVRGLEAFLRERLSR